MRELRAVRLLLSQSFSNYVSDPRVRNVLLHQDSQAVVEVLKAMVSAAKPMISVVRRLERMLR